MRNQFLPKIESLKMWCSLLLLMALWQGRAVAQCTTPITTFPYTESFDAGGLPTCWTPDAGAGYSVLWDQTTADGTYGVSGPYAGAGFIYLDVYDGDTPYNPYTITTPSFTLPAAAQQLSYYYYLGDGGYQGTGGDPSPLIVQISADSGATWTDIYSHDATNSTFGSSSATSDWHMNTINLAAFAGQTVQFRFYSTSNYGVGFTNQGIDEFSITAAPTCNPPTGVTVSGITATSATLSWTAPAVGTPVGYGWEIVAHNAGPWNGAVDSNLVLGTTTATSTALSPGTIYDVYVKSGCSLSNLSDTSVWSAVTSFNTSCLTVTSLPFTESFDAGLSVCWTASEAVAGSTVHWAAGTADATHGAAGPAAGTEFAYLDVYNAYTTYNPYYLTSPSITLGATTQQVSYYYFLGSTGNTTNPLVLQISTDTGATWTTIYTHTSANSTFASSSAVSNWYQNSVNLAAYVNQTVMFRFVGTSNYGSGRCNMGIDEFSITTAPTCYPPTGVTASNITSSSADLSWTAPALGSPAGYAYEVVAHNAGPWATPVVSNVVTAPTTTASTGAVLSANTTYDVYVKTGCSLTNLSDTSAWSAVYSFTTLCNAVTVLPWTEGFESLGTGVGTNIYPSCWAYTNITSTNYSCNGTCHSNGARTGTNSIGGSWSFNVWEFTPGFQLTAGTSYDYSFWYRTADNTNGYVVASAYGTSASRGAMTNPLGTITNAISSTGYTKVTYTFTPATSGVYYFGLHDSCPTSSPNGIAFDDFTLELTPACTVPSALTAGALTASGATFSWTASTSNPSGGYNWEVVASGAGAAGTAVASGSVAAGVTTATASGLTANTPYDIYVQANCGSSTSTWVGPLSITTACNAISTLPWTEGFETLPAAAGTNVYPSCWSYTNITSTNYSCNGTCHSNGAHTGTNSIGGSWSFNVWEFTPGFQLTAGTSYDYSFWYRTADNTNGYVVVSAYGTSANRTAMTNPLGTITNATSSTGYTKVTYTFTPATTGVYYFGLHDSCPTSAPNGIAFDDFALQLTPSCVVPTGLTAGGLTATTAGFSWTASTSAPANGYVYEVVAAGAGATGTPVSTGSVGAGITTATATGLSATTSYDIYVRAACSSTDSSTWVGPLSVTTPCVAVTSLPYTESFENATLAADCWSANAGAGYSYLWEPVTQDSTHGVFGPESGSQFARLNVYNAQTGYNPYTMTSPAIVLPAAMQQVSYWYFLGANGYTANTLRLLVSTNNGVSWDTIYTHSSANSSYASNYNTSNWHKNTIYLPQYVNTTAIFRFVGRSNYGSGRTNMGIDEFSITAAPTCFPPTGVTSSAVTATSATLSWTAPALGSPAGYAWEVVPTGAGSGATPVASNLVTAPTTTAATGSVLTPSTTYDVYVKTGCSLTNLSDTSTWSLVYTFSTPATCAAPTALTAGILTSSSASVSWTASVTNPSNGYIWEAVASGAGSTGTQVSSGTVAAGVTTASVSGLSPQTSYDIYVRSNCGADTSVWAGPLSVTTPCVAITTLPWSEGFETLPAAAAANVYPACWTYSNINSTNYTCSATCNSNTAHTGTNFMGGSWNFNVWEYTPGFQLTAGTNYDYSFWYRTTDATNGYVVVSAYGTAATSGAMTTTLGTITNAVSSGSYTKVTYTFQVPTTGVYYLGHHDSCPTFAPNGIAFDDFSLQLSPSCVAVGTPTLTTATSNGATISWPASLSAPANGYIWTVVPSGSAPSATPVATGTTAAGVTTAIVTGLNTNTAYVAYVRAVCSSTDSSAWSDTLHFVTTCTAATLPLIEGFNSLTRPACWSEQIIANNSPMQYVATMGYPTTSPQEGTDFVEWSSYTSPNTAGTETRLVSPVINTTGVPSVDISFYWLHDATNYTTGAYLNEGMTVQYSLNGTTWTDIQFYPRVDLTLQPTGSAWFQKLLTLPAAVANQPTVFIGFKFHSEYGNNCAFDNLHIYATPACAGSPSALAIGSVSPTTASVNWADASPAPAVGYHWFITPAGAGPGAAIDSGDVTVDTANITGLTPNTLYDFYVQSDCGGGSGLGSLAGPITVQTSCLNATLPLIEGFNNISIPSCWSQQYVVGNDDLLYQAASFNPTTAPQEGADYVFYNSYSFTNGNETRLVSPGITTTGVPSVDVSFYFYNEHSNNYNSGNYLTEGMTVQYSTDLINWTDVQFFPREDASFALGSGAWRQKYLTLPAGAGNQPTVYVGFKFHSAFGDNVSFDNLHIFQSSPCAGGPTAINVAPQSTTTVVVSWAPGAPAPSNGYNVVVVAAGDSVNGTVIASNSTAAGVTTDTITGLTANTAYDVYVRSNCDTIGVGYWVGPTGFSTPCNAITSIPWVENFESMTTVGRDIVPSCWLPTPSGRWESEDAPFFFPALDARSGTHYLTDRYNADDTIYTPSFALTGGTQYEFYFYYRTDGFTGWDSLYALMGTSQSPSGMTQVIGTPVAGPTNTQYVKYSAIFTPATSGDYFFGVRLLASFSPDDIAFDDFGLQEVVPCPNPPLAGVISGPSAVCPGSQINLSLTGYSPYTQLQWQGSLDSINWQDLLGANNDFYQDYPTNLTYYRVKVNCADSSYSPVFAVNMNAPTLCYCTSGLGGSCGGNDIDTARILGTNFNVNYTICNTTSNGDAYTIFPATGDSTTTLQRGGTYTFYLHMTGTSISSIWIDTNQNGLFDPYEWIQPTVAASSGTAAFTINGYTRLGTTGLRIRSRNQGNTNDSTSACDNFGSGETFDFQITIVDTNCNHTPTVTPTATMPTCYGSSNGSLSIALSGGLAPFTHMWSTGDTTTSLTNLGAGVYTDTITFGGGCTYIYTDTLAQPAMLSAMDSVTPVLCYGGATGTVTVTVSGGTAAYTHHWSTGATGAQLTGVAAGAYTDTISDNNGCTLTFVSDTVRQPATALSIVLDSATAAKCNSQSNGAIYTTASGGTGAYTYTWTGTSQTTDDVTGLAAGGYVVVVTDANQCTATLTDTVTQPAPVAIVIDSIVNAKCSGGMGSIYAHATGGSLPYSYLWTPGNVTTSLLYNKPAGTYALSVTDHNGCTATASNTITAPSPISLTTNITNQVQNGTPGAITVTATGGTQPYAYHWTPGGATTSTISNLTADLYTVTVTDANGCTATRSDSVRLILGLKDVTGDITDIYVYPNPSSAIFNVTVKLSHAMPVDVEVYTVTGQKIDVATKENSAADTFVLDMTNEASGVYIVKVKAGDQVVTQRVTLVK